MLLKIIVLLGLATYFLINKLWLFALLSILSLIPKYGLLVAIILAIALLGTAHYLLTAILTMFIAWNLIGNEILNRTTPKHDIDKTIELDISETDFNEMDKMTNYAPDYCRDYVLKIHGYSKEDAEIFLVDPEFGTSISKILFLWNRENHALNIDSIELLKRKDYRLNEMKKLNSVIDDYVGTFKRKKPEILRYLDVIGVQLKIPE